MTSRPKVLIVGTGAIGSFYSAILKKSGCQISTVLRSNYETVKNQGVRITSKLGDLSYQPDYIYRDDDLPKDTPDFLILSIKVLPEVDQVKLIKPWLGENTCLVLIQNGLDIEKELAAAYPNNPIISCLAFIAASSNEAGIVEHKAYGKLVMGCYPEGIDENCHTLAKLFIDGGINIDLTESVVAERWRKCVWNTPFNPLSVVANGADTQTILTTSGGEELVRAMMHEVINVAAAEGYTLDSKIIDQNIENTKKMPAYKNSMALDYLNDRPIEREAILGNVVSIAMKHSIPVPHLNTLLVTLKIRAQLEGRL